MALYTVKQGDTLYGIAQRLLGDGTQYTAIVDLNPQITDPNLIQVGEILEVPDTSASQAAQAESPSAVVTAPAATDSGAKDQKLLMAAVLVGVAAAGYWWWIGQKKQVASNPEEEEEPEEPEENEESEEFIED